MKKYLTEYIDCVDGVIVTMCGIDVYATSWEEAEATLAALGMSYMSVIGELDSVYSETGEDTTHQDFLNFPTCFS